MTDFPHTLTFSLKPGVQFCECRGQHCCICKTEEELTYIEIGEEVRRICRACMKFNLSPSAPLY